MTTQASARLTKELKDLTKNPPGGFKVELKEDANLFEWAVFIAGPPDTDYEGGVFKCLMNFPDDYPNSPPKLKFLSDFWHPNVYPDGNVCISILHTPDPFNTEEKAEETWRPIQTVESILVSVISMLSDPNFSSPANVDASVELRKSPQAYKQKIRKIVEKSKKELPPGFEMPQPKKPVLEKSESIDDLLLEDTADYGSDDDDMNEEDENGEEEEEDGGGEEEEVD